MDGEEIKLLIVYENEAHLKAIDEIFKGPGHHILQASSVSEAEGKIRDEQFDMIVIDAALNDPKGFEAAYSRATNDTRNVPVILFFAFNEIMDGFSVLGSSQDYARRAGTSRVFQLLQEKLAEYSRFKNDHAKLLEALRDKELLLAEMQHRIKNNLQTISSMLNIQTSFTQDQKSLSLIQDIQSRISSIALVYDVLFESSDTGMIDFSAYLRGLIKNLLQVFSVDQKRIHITYHIEDIVLHRDRAIHCGLILNELLTNAIKYAFSDGRAGEITISLSRMADGRLEMGVGDNGIGVPDDFDYKTTESMGLLLINTLTAQIHGTLCFDRTNGTNFTLVFDS